MYQCMSRYHRKLYDPAHIFILLKGLLFGKIDGLNEI